MIKKKRGNAFGQHAATTPRVENKRGKDSAGASQRAMQVEGRPTDCAESSVGSSARYGNHTIIYNTDENIYSSELSDDELPESPGSPESFYFSDLEERYNLTTSTNALLQDVQVYDGTSTQIKKQLEQLYNTATLKDPSTSVIHHCYNNGRCICTYCGVTYALRFSSCRKCKLPLTKYILPSALLGPPIAPND
jgi:hypothetical protein